MLQLLATSAKERIGMATNKQDDQHLLLVERESVDQAFWCEPVDSVDGKGSASLENEFGGCGQCGCGCGCSCGSSCGGN